MKILAIIPSMECPTSFWRAVGPLSYLRDLHVTYNGTDGTWPTLMGYDLVFLQRPSSKQHVEIMRRCQLMGLKTWVDYDDNVLRVPLSNPAFSHYGDRAVQENIKECLALATTVTVSTEPLRKAFREDAHVIRNSWDSHLFPDTPIETPNKTIICRGSSTHDQDVLTHLESIIKIHQEYPEYNWVFMGGINWQAVQHLDMKRVKVVKPTDPISYMHLLKHHKPEWFLVPLTDTNFNHCKSDIAWLEATYAGAACLGPLFYEWQSPGIANYDDDLYQAFKEVKDTAKDMVNLSRKYIRAERDLIQANQQRLEVIK